MPGSFLARHRTICEVLEEIRTVSKSYIPNMNGKPEQIDALVDEAKDYAQRMSVKLTEYKVKRDGEV